MAIGMVSEYCCSESIVFNVKSYYNECNLENLCTVELQLTIKFVSESNFLHFFQFFTAILVLAVLEVASVHSPLFSIYCTCVVRS